MPVWLKMLVFMLCSAGIMNSQTTYTANFIVSDSAHVSYTRTDSLVTDRLRVTDTICTAQNICIQNNARVAGDVRVTGDVLFNNTSIGLRSFTTTSFSNLKFLNIGEGADLSKIPAIACMTISQYAGNSSFLHQANGGFVSSHVNQSFVFYQAPWGQAHIETEGVLSSNPQNGNPLLVNYFCGNDIVLGGQSVSTPKYTRVFLERFVRAMKHVEIGDSVNGISGDNNNIGLLVHTHGGAGVKVRTYSSNLNAISIQNTGSQAPENYNGLHTFQVRGDGQTTILTKEYNAALTVKQFNNASSTPTVFQIGGTGETRIYTHHTLTPFSIETSTGTVFRVTGNRRVGIGTGSPNCGLEIEPEQNINGVCVKVNHTQPYGFGFTFEGQNAQAETKAYRVWWNNKEMFVVYANGKTFIGEKKVTGQHDDALLQVDGKVACKSFYVLKPTTWADEVFKKEYEINLNEIENYIRKHHHLPGIPSESEILTKGYDINDMNARLLSKIEELYLIIIRLQNKYIELENRMMNHK